MAHIRFRAPFPHSGADGGTRADTAREIPQRNRLRSGDLLVAWWIGRPRKFFYITYQGRLFGSDAAADLLRSKENQNRFVGGLLGTMANPIPFGRICESRRCLPCKPL